MNDTLTAPSKTCNAASHAGKILTFTAGQETYGVPVIKVRKILQCITITPVPYAPAYIKGVMNLHGKIIPVMDVRVRFGREEAQINGRSCIVVVQMTLPSRASVLLGLIVDAVEEVIHVTDEDIEETPEFGTAIDTSYLDGIIKVDGRVVLLLEVDRMLGDVELPAAQ